jgi:hypothetical protein
MDRYKNGLKRAGFDWMEEPRSRKKDRIDGRAEKRGARQQDRKEIVTDAELPRRPPCPVCGWEDCDGPRDLPLEEIERQREGLVDVGP